MLKIVALSDTHNEHNEVTVPDGDVLIFAGDFMTCGRRMNEVISFGKWFREQPHKHKILVAGNHDRLMESNFLQCTPYFEGVNYLRDNYVVIDGVKFWGSPYQPWFYDWAFNVHRGAPIKKHWDLIPNGTDVLITHGPPMGILDQAIPDEMRSTWNGDFIVPATEHVGCEELKIAVDRAHPKFHFFGHIHGSYGTAYYDGMEFHNVSICDEQYNPTREPHVVNFEKR
jgi:Icc-related predicted phosphoesterase